jgi:methionyl-tRNA formyltransferase
MATRPRIFFFANQGHGTTAVKAAMAAGSEILGVCSAPDRPWWRSKLSALRSRPFRDPFASFQHPFRFPGLHCLPSRDLGLVKDFVRASKPDLVLSCSFHRLIPTDIFEAAAGAYNVHAGLLPERGGGTPNRWAIREGDRETGVTAHVLSKTFDGGDIVWQRRVPIAADAVWGEVEASLTPLVAEAVTALIMAQAEGRVLARTPQTPRLQKSYRGETYVGQPAAECGRICRATLPKFCGLGLADCRRRSPETRPCGRDIARTSA